MKVDGKRIAAEIIEEVKGMSMQSKRVCFLVSSEESQSYIRIKSKIAEELGVAYDIKEFDPSSYKTVFKEGYDAIVIQLPLKEGVDIDKVFNSLPAKLDIDMLGSEAKTKFLQGETERMPPVAAAVDEILRRELVDLDGKNILILGKGRLVGEPVAMMLEQRLIPYHTVSKESPGGEIDESIKAADVIISGIGVPHFIKPQMLRPGVVLIDLGTSEEGGKLSGDADPECESVSSIFTPVPGGAGPITVACLFRNLFLE